MTLPGLGSDPVFAEVIKVSTQLYLFCFSAFLALKQVFFYRIKGNNNVIRLIKKSDHQNNFLLQGVIIALLSLVYIYYTETLMSFSTIMVGVLLFYYLMQVLINGNPSVYLDDESFSYDDYFVQAWPWRTVDKIEAVDEELRLFAAERDFVLDFELIDDMDFVRLNDEVERSVLDGQFASDKSSKKLLEVIEDYARNYNIQFNV